MRSGWAGAWMVAPQAGQGPVTPPMVAGTRSCTAQFGQLKEIRSWLMSVSKRGSGLQSESSPAPLEGAH